ncbi:tetratricopeptide repeat protein [candidate division KSB1 bacterium]|nr:tetratricopeptide repeat protein [candidate division KSB1 bacterium]NIR72003.1 tetratricopeptide repeat protein [candidate division KSB1 bacterium]NIS24996.1 tetratricopeptide repeat protein [candidate division KSB1 bacterium]NIT71912.1 tetratricopeptide repeat protein [candidate division KSB1 bacterium]NIU25651.1 tetratricopeptide repeat protein [candidate division KSB1 bacterium]
MNCVSCNAELPQEAKFCPECGTKIGDMECSNCGEPLKPGAKFCHSCGSAADSESQAHETTQAEGGTTQKSWLATIGPFLFIPVFVGIIVILFWKNREPEPMNASNATAAEQSAPSMAAMGQVHETLERLKQRVEENPDDLVAIDSLATMYSIAGSYDKARKFYERHLEIEPDNQQIKIALGLTYHSLNRTEEGIELIEGILQEEPTHAFALFYLAEIYASSGEMKVAEEHWNKIIDHYPNTEIANMAQQRIHEYKHTDSN